ncbi:MAG: sialidase family protein [Gemmataceae bacterium]
MRFGILGQLCWIVACVAGPIDRCHGQDEGVVRTVVRRQGDDGVHTYRIPGLTTTTKGTLIAIFDVRRKGAGDLPGDIDTGAMRSTDQGKTWTKMQMVLDFDVNEKGARGNGVGDPAILVDRKTGRIIVVGLWSKGNRAWNGSGPGLTPDETGQMVLAHSDDDGKTWSKPTNITAKIAGRARSGVCAFKVGAGIQLADGTLAFAAQFRDSAGVPHACFMTSGDGGVTWNPTQPAIPAKPATSEAQIAQLDDGSVLITMRDESRSGKRSWARFEWAGDLRKGKWSEPWSTVPDPTCMASLIRHPKGLLILSSPGSARERKALTVRSSGDGGKTWCAGRVLDPRPCAYSCLTVLDDGTLGVLYECGEKHAYETLTFARFSLAWATSP